MILSEELVWAGKKPELLKALRTDPVLHEEAVLMYNKLNVKVTLNPANKWSLDGLSAETLKHARILQIDFEYVEPAVLFIALS